MRMKKYVAAYGSAALLMLLFYVVYALGLLVIVIATQAQLLAGTWLSVMSRGALFGLVAYATYDLTNLATLKDWPLQVALVYMAWGAFASGCASLAGRAAWRWCAPRSRFD